MNVTYPLLVKEFHQPLATVQWITTAYLLTVTIVMGTTPSLLLLGLALFAIIYALSLIGTSSLISGLSFCQAPAWGPSSRLLPGNWPTSGASSSG